MSTLPYELSDSEKTPVTCITGFLGAGKTTLLNHILTANHGYKYAVIENEFGEVGIDRDLIKAGETPAEEIVAMDNGCLCCTVRDDLVKGVRRLLGLGKKLDGIIIETTGMADPAPVIQTFYSTEDLKRRCKVDAVITMVDCKHVSYHLFKECPLGAVNEAIQQIAFSDRILLNKVDLVSQQELVDLRAAVKQINCAADVIECEQARVDVGKLVGISSFSLDKMLELDPDWLESLDGDHGHDHGHGHEEGGDGGHGHDHAKKEEDSGHGHGHDHKEKKGSDGHDHGHDHEKKKEDGHDHGHGHAHQKEKKIKPAPRRYLHDTSVSSVGIVMDPGVCFEKRKLEAWLKDLITTKKDVLYRYKGLLSVKGTDEKLVFQGIHETIEADFIGNWTIPEEERQSKFVFIGKNLDREELLSAFKTCVAGPLRFGVGTRVRAKVRGGWSLGEISAQWEGGNPYRIKMDDGREVFGPVDDDRVVVKA